MTQFGDAPERRCHLPVPRKERCARSARNREGHSGILQLACDPAVIAQKAGWAAAKTYSHVACFGVCQGASSCAPEEATRGFSLETSPRGVQDDYLDDQGRFHRKAFTWAPCTMECTNLCPVDKPKSGTDSLEGSRQRSGAFSPHEVVANSASVPRGLISGCYDEVCTQWESLEPV